MAGKIKKLIDCIIKTNSKGNQALYNLTRTKLMLKGINPDAYNLYSEDNLQIIEKLENFISDAGLHSCMNGESKMNITIAYSTKKTAIDAVNDIKNHFKNFDPRLVIFFASSSFNPDAISKEMKNAFENIPTIGCSTAGEIVSGKMLKNSVVAMALNSEIINDVKVEVVERIKEENKIPEVFKSFESYYGKRMKELDFTEYVGIILFDGLSKAEEKIMEKIGDLSDIVFLGASAGDYLNFSSTYVYANGEAYTDSAAIALVKPATAFDLIKTQSFCIFDKKLDTTGAEYQPTEIKLTATKVNLQNREVIELDNKPAAIAYAEALGVPVEEAPHYFMHNPLGLMINNEPYVRSPQQIKGNSIIFYCNIPEGTELSVLESTNIIEDTQKAINNKLNELGSISGIINFNCILRALELEKKGLSAEYVKIFENIPTIGFNTYGEEYIGHINQTSTMLVFK